MLTVRDFHAADEAAVIDLILPIQTSEFGVAITADDQPDLRAIASFYQTGAGAFLVACWGDRLVGTIALKDLGDGSAALRKMFVAAPFRGREYGVADALLARALDHAANHGIGEILLGTTEQYLAAHRFYEKHGFTEIAAEALPARFPRMAVDTRFYRKLLG